MTDSPTKMIKRMYSVTHVIDRWLDVEARKLGIAKSEFLRRVLDSVRVSTVK
jgi:hypothetical protein